MIPGCVQQPRIPFAIAAGGPRTLALAARQADAWITFGDPTDPDPQPADIERAVSVQAERLDQECAAISRDPAAIDRMFLLGNSSERPLSSIEAFADFVGRYAALGFTDIVFHDPRPGDPRWGQDPAIVDAIAAEFLT